MIHSNWDDWFVRDEIEGTRPDGLTLWYLGCNSVVLRTAETTLYIDPYFGDGDPPRLVRMIPVPLDPADATLCDAVLVTHEHIDHMHEPSYWPLVDDLGAELYATTTCYTDPDYEQRHEIPDAQRHAIEPGDEVEFGDLTVHVRAGNDPDASGEVSFVFEHESGTYFNSGDSRPDPVFEAIGEEFDIDVGSLTMGSTGRIRYPEEDESRIETWYSDENDVIALANALELDRLLPVHYDTWKGVGVDPKSLHEHAASFESPRTIEPVEIGDRVDVGRPGIVPRRTLGE
jgi:L-ascorbate 6-phosphate lactonase